MDATELTGTNRSRGLTTICTNYSGRARRCYALPQRHSILIVIAFAGGYSGGATPVPIPNTVVKPSSADGTDLGTDRESKSLPAFFLNKARIAGGTPSDTCLF